MTTLQIFEQLPQWAQFVALNAYGLAVRRRASQNPRLRDQIAKSEHWSRDDQKGYVDERLRHVLAQAVTSVPRYAGLRRYLSAIEDRSSSVFEILGLFPPVSKREIAEDPAAFRSVLFRSGRLIRTQTSGSTGTPLTIWLTPEAKQLADALWHRRAVWAGYCKGDWIARIVGDPVILCGEKAGRSVFRESYPDRRLYFSSRDLTPTVIPKIVDALNRRKPAFVMGYPSALGFIASEGQRFAPLRYRPKAVLYSSEPMLAHQRDRIEEYFQGPIRSLYGCAERIVSAAECEAGSHHLSVLDGYVEGQFTSHLQDSTGLITGLRNPAMPLIRYDLGDEISVLPSSTCSCGRTLPIISPVESRRGDAIVTRDGRCVPAPLLTLVFKDLAPIRRTQLIQESAQDVQVWIDVDPAVAESIVRTVRERIDKALFGEMRVKVRISKEMEATLGGKIPFVINRLSAPQQRSAEGG